MTPKLLIGTSNPAKLLRLRAILRELDLEIATPADAGPPPDAAEGERSHRANAEAKARAWALRSGLATLASDGGLHIPALGDRWRSTRTRRAAGDEATDEERAHHLLELLRDVRGSDRVAFHVEAAALARADSRLLASWEAVGAPREVATTYDPRHVPAGFWLPGLLLFGPERRRYGDLAAGERDALDDHWVKLAPLVRDGVQGLLRECDAQGRGVAGQVATQTE